MSVGPGDLLRILPLLCLAGAALLGLLVAAFRPEDRQVSPLVTAAGVLAAIGSIAFFGWNAAVRSSAPILGGMLAMDFYALFFTIIVLAMLIGATSIGISGTRASEYAHGEYWPLLSLSACGMVLLAASTHLLITFIGVELMSLPIYALVASDRRRSRPPEAALKYFLLGAFSSAFLLFGIAFVYGSTLHLDYAGIADAVRAGGSGSERAELLLGIALMTVGFGFKTSSVPFHMWTPDAYTGAPTPVTGFMASAVKAASFAAFVRLFIAVLGRPAEVMPFWSNVIAALAAATVVVGNLGAISQRELKRMLAYSGIAHAGYLLIGLRAGSMLPGSAMPAILYYLLAYTFTVMGAFAMVVALERWRGREILLEDLNGLSARHPTVAAAIALFMLSLAGIPPTAGFAGKLYVFSAAVQVGDYGLAVLGVLASAVSLFYYLRVVVLMYMGDPALAPADQPAAAEPEARMPSVHAVAAIAALLVLVIGIAPAWYLGTARLASASALSNGRLSADTQAPTPPSLAVGANPR